MAALLSLSRLLRPVPVAVLAPGSPRAGCVQCSHFSTTSAVLARMRSPPNLIINFVPQQQAWVVERFGKYLRTLQPGLNFLLPIIDNIRYVQSLKENAIDIPSQSAITEDNVTLHLDGVLYYRVIDPYKASYGVEDADFAVMQLAQTTMRSELGKIKLDKVFQERTSLNFSIVEAINHAAEAWGILCMRYEIKDIQLPTKVKEAMQMQVEAERKKRANILESEGARESAINRAEGLRQSKILASEAVRIEQVNKAKGEAAAILARAQARAQALNTVGSSIGREHGSKAASLVVAEQYVQAFSQLAKTGNTLLLPEKTGDVGSMVVQAMGIYSHMTNSKVPPTGGAAPPSSTSDPTRSKVATPDSAQSQAGTSEEDDFTSATMKDLEVTLEELSKSIEDTIATSAGPSAVEKEEQPPHFTVATSPTRNLSKNPKDPRSEF